jgi:cardiolipin synthase
MPAVQTFLRLAIPNGLSAIRMGLGLAFPFVPHAWRLTIVIIAAVTDALDGFAARRLHVESDVGQMLDPIADRIFVLIVSGVLLAEGAIDPLWAGLVVARDVVVLCGSTYVIGRRQWSRTRRLRPSILGKCTTAAQFAVLLTLVGWSGAPVWLLGITAALSIGAAADYARRFLSGQKENREDAKARRKHEED